MASKMNTNEAFWRCAWEGMEASNEYGSPEGILASIRSTSALCFLEEAKRDDFSLFSISWVAHTYATSKIEIATSKSGVSDSFGWRHRLTCLVVLELACSCENGCFPETNISVLSVQVDKSNSPFFPLLVQSALYSLNRAMEEKHELESSVDSDNQLAQATLLEFVEGAVLIDMLGQELHDDLQQAIVQGKVSDELRANIDVAVKSWTAVYADNATDVDPLLPFSSLDETQKQHFRGILSSDTTKLKSRIESTDLLRVDMASHSLRAPFFRPLPPPSFPLAGYEADDLESLTTIEEAELLEFLHADLIWCTPVCSRIMLLPDDEDNEKHANESMMQLLELLHNKATSSPLAPSERRQVIDFLSSSENAIQLIQEAGLTPQNLPRLVEHNPLIAYECLLHILQILPEEERNEYLSSLVGMDMSLHSMEVVNRLATHFVMSTDTASSDSNLTRRRSKQDILQPDRLKENTKPILHTEYIHLFIGSCIASCENIQDRHAQNRLVRLVCVFIQSLLRNKIVETEDIYFEVQSFCVEFSRIREASALFKSLKQQHVG